MGVPTQPIPRSLWGSSLASASLLPSSNEREGQGSATHLGFTSLGAPLPSSDSNILHSTHETNPVPMPHSRGGAWSPKTQDTPKVREWPVSAPIPRRPWLLWTQTNCTTFLCSQRCWVLSLPPGRGAGVPKATQKHVRKVLGWCALTQGTKLVPPCTLWPHRSSNSHSEKSLALPLPLPRTLPQIPTRLISCYSALSSRLHPLGPSHSLSHSITVPYVISGGGGASIFLTAFDTQ